MKYSWRSGRGRHQSVPRCQSDLVLGDVQYPIVWLPVGLTAAVVVGAAVWPGDRFTRVVVALCLIAVVIVGYFLLPNVFDVDQLIRRVGLRSRRAGTVRPQPVVHECPLP
jgi:hypothetical protein